MRSPSAKIIWAFLIAPLAPGMALALLFVTYEELTSFLPGHAPVSITSIAFHLFGAAFGTVFIMVFVTPWSLLLGYPALMLGIPAYFILKSLNLTNPPAYLATGCLTGALYFEILDLSNRHNWKHFIFFNGFFKTNIALFLMLAGTISALAFWLIARPDRPQNAA